MRRRLAPIGVALLTVLALAPSSASAADLAPLGPDPVLAAGEKRVPTGCRRGGNPFRQNGPRNHRLVALTFDDGPSPYTADVIRVLVKMKAKGTFFQLGQNIPGREQTLKRILGWGFELANHSYSHPQLPSADQLRMTSNRIRAATGFTPCLFRPPYGAVNNALINRARGLGMMTINWDVDPLDWQTPGAGTIYRRVVGNVRPGSIVLMHDGGGPRGQTVAALPDIIRTLRARRYRFVTVTELLGHRFTYGS